MHADGRTAATVEDEEKEKGEEIYREEKSECARERRERGREREEDREREGDKERVNYRESEKKRKRDREAS